MGVGEKEREELIKESERNIFFAGRQIPQGVVIPGVTGDEGIERRQRKETRSPFTICSLSTSRLLPLIPLCSFGSQFCTFCWRSPYVERFLRCRNQRWLCNLSKLREIF